MSSDGSGIMSCQSKHHYSRLDKTKLKLIEEIKEDLQRELDQLRRQRRQKEKRVRNKINHSVNAT